MKSIAASQILTTMWSVWRLSLDLGYGVALLGLCVAITALIRYAFDNWTDQGLRISGWS